MTNTIKASGVLLLLLTLLSVYLFSNGKESQSVNTSLSNPAVTNTDEHITQDIANKTIDNEVDASRDTSVMSSEAVDDALNRYLERNPLPASLEDVEIDGEIAFNTSGQLEKTRRLRNLFDQLLTLSSEWDNQAIRIWLLGYAQVASQSLNAPDDGVTQVVESFDTYLEYLKATDSIIPESSYVNEDFVANFKQVSDAMYTLRREYFGNEVADNYFKVEEQYDRTQYDRAVIYLDTTLTEEERETKLDAWRASIPDPVQRDIEMEKKKLEDLDKQVASLRANGASNDAIFSARKEAYGEEAAQRLAELDQQQTAWKQRSSDYKAHHESLIQQGLAPEEIALNMEAYAKDRFSEAEQRRLPKLY